MGKKHVSWDFLKDYHPPEGDAIGCVWIHASGWGETPCHYAMNGYTASGGRLEMYNKDHRAAAKALGYAIETPSAGSSSEGALAPTNRARREAGGKALSVRKQKAAEGKPFNIKTFREKYAKRFGRSLDWLARSSEGWHYGYLLPMEHVPPWRRHHGRQHTFQVYDWRNKKEGYGAWYPYHHNYHHMLPESALHKYVIGNDDKAKQRVEIICASKWNINKGLNIVLLPQEVAVSKIVGLPAHCPWGIKSHPEYSDSMSDKLRDVKKQLDRATKTGACEDTNQVALSLDKVCESILKQIKTMKPGRQIGRVW